MAEAAEMLFQVLEVLTRSHQRMAETFTRLEERQLEHSRFLAESLQRLSAQVEAGNQRLADHSRAMAEILERVVHTTDRTEQMTARILAEVTKSGAH
jgi:hypothetical protein